jgi:hypothetical protein
LAYVDESKFLIEKIMKQKWTVKTVTLACVSLLVLVTSIYLTAADHADSPAVMGTGSDITDLYAFQSPSNPNNLVFVVNVQGFIASGSATANASFDEEVMLEINIDNNGDAKEDLVLQATFENGKVKVYGPVAPIQSGVTSTLVTATTVTEAAITKGTAAPVIGEKNGIKVFAGPRDDPFFFDLVTFREIIKGNASSFNNPGTDSFKGTNILSLVVEVPKSMVGSGASVNAWATSNRKM